MRRVGREEEEKKDWQLLLLLLLLLVLPRTAMREARRKMARLVRASPQQE